jgi:hypothetical protein
MRVRSGFVPTQRGMDAQRADGLDPWPVCPHHLYQQTNRDGSSQLPSRQDRDAAGAHLGPPLTATNDMEQMMAIPASVDGGDRSDAVGLPPNSPILCNPM